MVFAENEGKELMVGMKDKSWWVGRKGKEVKVGWQV